MSGEYIADNGICSFRDYVVDTSPEEMRKHLGCEPKCVADRIQAWVQSGQGVRACLGDFTTFMITVIAIMNAYLVANDIGLLECVVNEEDPDGPFVKEPRPDTIFGPRDLKHDILDPHFFATWTFRVLHPKGGTYRHW